MFFTSQVELQFSMVVWRELLRGLAVETLRIGASWVAELSRPKTPSSCLDRGLDLEGRLRDSWQSGEDLKKCELHKGQLLELVAQPGPLIHLVIFIVGLVSGCIGTLLILSYGQRTVAQRGQPLEICLPYQKSPCSIGKDAVEQDGVSEAVASARRRARTLSRRRDPSPL